MREHLVPTRNPCVFFHPVPKLLATPVGNMLAKDGGHYVGWISCVGIGRISVPLRKI